jgi:hypothetical protein
MLITCLGMVLNPRPPHRYLGVATAEPVLRTFALPNGDKIVSLRRGTLDSAVHAAGASLRGDGGLRVTADVDRAKATR